jgi:hypothetical protein
MISALFRKNLPFALAISKRSFGDSDNTDKFIIIPSSGSMDYLKHISKDYLTVECREVKPADWEWFKSNKSLFKLAHTCSEGVVYEPNYGFRDKIRKTQTQLL